MQTPARHALTFIFAVLLAPQAALAATPAVGIDISAQIWDPLHPEADTPKSLYDAPAGISGPMNTAWNKARSAMVDAVPKALAELDLGGGFRLYGVQFNVNELGPISLAQVSPAQPGGAAPLRLHWTIPATHMALKVRTPGPAPQGTDPGFSATVDLDLAVAIAVSDTPGRTLQVTEVRVAVPKDGVHFQGDNPTGDVMVALTSLLSEVATGKNLNTLLNLILDDQNFADGNKNSLALFAPALRRIDVAALANTELASVNQAIRVPASYVHIGQWLKRSAQGQVLSVLFAPRNLPLPPANGTMSGWVHFNTQQAPTPLPAGCEAAMFSIVGVQVQTGPRPILDAAPWRFGDAPLQAVGSAALTTGALDAKNSRCAYHLNGLVAGWPNRIEFRKRTAQGPSHYVPNPKQYWALTPQGWASPQVPTGAGPDAGAVLRSMSAGAVDRDLIASLDTVGSVTVGALKAPGAALVQPSNPGDPATVWNTKSQAGKVAPVQQADKAKQITWGR